MRTTILDITKKKYWIAKQTNERCGLLGKNANGETSKF